MPRRTLKELIAKIGGGTWSNAGCHVCLIARDTKQMLLVRPSASNDCLQFRHPLAHDFWMWPIEGLTADETTAEGAQRVMASHLGLVVPKAKVLDHLKFVKPHHQPGLRAHLVEVDREFIPSLSLDYGDFMWIKPFVDMPPTVSMALSRVFDDNYSLLALAKAVNATKIF